MAALDNLALKGKAKGDALANLVCHILRNIPGVGAVATSRLDAFHAQEVDIVFEQQTHADGFPADDHLPHRIVVECKNMAGPANAMDVAWFYYKLQTRSQPFGILISRNGLTGSRGRGSAAQDVIKTAMLQGIFLIALNGDEVRAFTDTAQFVTKVKDRITELVISRTNFC